MIRPAAANDLNEVFGLACQLSSKFIIELPAFEKAFSQLLVSEDVYLNVIEESGKTIGYLLGWSRLAFYSNGPVGWVQEIVIQPSHRRRGMGQLLMNDFERWMSLRGGRLVSLTTRGAPEFYLALGYTE
jgi:GNAT superfamily N-acetyltransferase